MKTSPSNDLTYIPPNRIGGKHKWILLDIHFTCFIGTYIHKNITARPYLKEFIEYFWHECDDNYDVAFYTAGYTADVAEACLHLITVLGMDGKHVERMFHNSFSTDNMPQTACRDSTGKIISWMKPLDKLPAKLKCSIDDIVILIDDNIEQLDWDYQEKRLLCPRFNDETTDTFFLDLLEHFKKTGKFKTNKG